MSAHANKVCTLTMIQFEDETLTLELRRNGNVMQVRIPGQEESIIEVHNKSGTYHFRKNGVEVVPPYTVKVQVFAHEVFCPMDIKMFLTYGKFKSYSARMEVPVTYNDKKLRPLEYKTSKDETTKEMVVVKQVTCGKNELPQACVIRRMDDDLHILTVDRMRVSVYHALMMTLPFAWQAK